MTNEYLQIAYINYGNSYSEYFPIKAILDLSYDTYSKWETSLELGGNVVDLKSSIIVLPNFNRPVYFIQSSNFFPPLIEYMWDNTEVAVLDFAHKIIMDREKYPGPFGKIKLIIDGFRKTGTPVILICRYSETEPVLEQVRQILNLHDSEPLTFYKAGETDVVINALEQGLKSFILG